MERFCETDCRENWEAECATVCGLEEEKAMTSTGGAQKPPADGGKEAGADADKPPPMSKLDAGTPIQDSATPDASPTPPMCPADCPAALCDGASGKCSPCEEDIDCEVPRGACFKGECVACADDDDCGDMDEPICEPVGHTCVGCYEHSDCTNPSKSHCQDTTCVSCQSDRDCHDPRLPQCSEGTCVGCTSDTQCAHFPLGMRACNPNSGACVECTSASPDACRGRVCDAINNACTDIDPKTAEQCEACVSNAQCKDGLQCVMERFVDKGVEQELGYLCLPDGEVTGCQVFYPFRKFTTERNIDGDPVSTCHLASTTCEGLSDYGKECADDAGVPDDDACGVPGVRDGFCIMDKESTSAVMYRCTASCSIDDDCHFTQGCVRIGLDPWMCTL